MSDYQAVFKRYESKYLLHASQYEALLNRMRPYMEIDRYGRHTISSVYLDTPDFALIRASLEKPVYKEKIRLRSYGTPRVAADPVFLELKKKYRGVVYKRRMAMTLGEATAYLERGIPPAEQGQIFQEIDWFMARFRPEPKALIAYDRIALAGRPEPGPGSDLRITIDNAVRFRSSVLDLSKGDWGTLLLPRDIYLMEVKTPEALPLWLVHTLSELGVYPASFSKYGACYQSYLSAAIQLGGIICA